LGKNGKPSEIGLMVTSPSTMAVLVVLTVFFLILSSPGGADIV
jgi:hypothetical protein